MKKTLILLLLLAIPPAAVSQSGDSAKDAIRVRAACEGIIVANNMADLKAVERLYTDYAVWMPPTGAEVAGKAAILDRYKETFKSFTQRLRAETGEIVIAGDWAVARGFTRGERVPKGGGAAVPVNEKYMMALHRNTAGKWQIARLMWNPA